MTPSEGLLAISDRGYWQAKAACHPSRRPEGMGPAEWTALFFPDRGTNATTIRKALEVCARCPVRAECDAEAEATPQPREGIWGGRSRRQRRAAHARLPVGTPGYPPSKREEALRLYRSGLTASEAAGRCGVSVVTLRNWRREADDLSPDDQ